MADHPDAVWYAEAWANRNLAHLQGSAPVCLPGQTHFDLGAAGLMSELLGIKPSTLAENAGRLAQAHRSS